MVVVKSVGVLPLGKMLCCLYALLGLIIGGGVSLLSLAGAFASRGSGSGAAPFMFGAAAVVLFPVIYGAIGFVGGVIVAALYNLIAAVAGGIEVELQGPAASPPPAAY